LTRSRTFMTSSLFVVLTLLMFFNNCSAVNMGGTNSGVEEQQSTPQSQMNGTNGGFDGKLYGLVDFCPGVPVGFKSLISFNVDFTEAYLTRENCEDLLPPYQNRINDIRLDTVLGVLSFSGDVFDVVANSNTIPLMSYAYCVPRYPLISSFQQTSLSIGKDLITSQLYALTKMDERDTAHKYTVIRSPTGAAASVETFTGGDAYSTFTITIDPYTGFGYYSNNTQNSTPLSCEMRGGVLTFQSTKFAKSSGI
jgi:hypothetical protein